MPCRCGRLCSWPSSYICWFMWDKPWWGGYVPGFATSLLLVPYVAYGLRSIWLVMSRGELIAWGVAGIVVMAVNLRFAHWLGI
ncbi:MAG: hypothetical protein MR319_03855 [Mediterranea sp.]|nr:hypothetical protein [Mediterranea sp.]